MFEFMHIVLLINYKRINDTIQQIEIDFIEQQICLIESALYDQINLSYNKLIKMFFGYSNYNFF